MSTQASEQRKKQIVIGVFGLLVLFLVYRVYDSFFGGITTAPPPPVIVTAPAAKTPGQVVATPPGNVARSTATKLGTTSGQLDPTLHEEAMRVTENLVYTGIGRNIFAGGGVQDAPVKIAVVPKTLAPARPVVAAYVPPPPPATCPPTCPPIQLKFFGTSTSASGVRKAFLLQGDDVFLASAGDVVQRKYRVVSISGNSIVVEDIPNINKQTLPLVAN